MSRRDSIQQSFREFSNYVLRAMGHKYPAVANYRVRVLERRKLWHLAIAAVALVLGGISHVLPESGWWTVVIVAFVVGAETALLWQEYVELAEPRNANISIVNAFDEVMTQVEVAELPTGYELKRFGDGAYICSDDVDQWIQRNPNIRLDVRPGSCEKSVLEYNAPYQLEAFDYLITRLHKSNTRFFNEAKVSLRTELNPQQLIDSRMSVTLSRTSYIASALTNDACTNKLVREGDRQGTVYANLTEMFPIETRRSKPYLLTLDDSQLSNHLGASTIALFRQANGTCVIVLPQQGPSAARSSGKLAPTGSGSIDWSDIAASGATDLLSLVARAAIRELCEEQGMLGLRQSKEALNRLILHHHLDTYVLGYYRWLDYGGLPQFCCLSLVLNQNIEDLRPDSRELQPRVTSGALRFEKRRIVSIHQLADYCDEKLRDTEQLSLPLAVNLRLIWTMIRSSNESCARITTFIQTRFPELS